MNGEQRKIFEAGYRLGFKRCCNREVRVLDDELSKGLLLLAIWRHDNQCFTEVFNCPTCDDILEWEWNGKDYEWLCDNCDESHPGYVDMKASEQA